MIFSNKVIKSIVLLVLFSFILFGCGKPKPDAVVISFLTALQENNYETAMTYMDTGNNTSSKSFGTFDDETQELILNSVLQNIEFENVTIQSSEDDKAIVTVSMTSLDCPSIMREVLSETIKTAYAAAYVGRDDMDTEEIFNTLTFDAFSSPDAPKTQTDITINLIKTNDGWKVVGDLELADGLTGGLVTAYSRFYK